MVSEATVYSHLTHFFGPMMAKWIVGIGYVSGRGNLPHGSLEAEGGVAWLGLDILCKAYSQWPKFFTSLIVSTS